MKEPKIVCAERLLLGEGPLWHPEEKCLYWVDIIAAALYRLDITDGTARKFIMPTEITSLGWRQQGGLVAAFRDRFVSIDTKAYDNKKTLPIQTLAFPLHWKNSVMFNDGKCDKQGRFWAGTKDIKEKEPIAGLYCLNKEGKVSEVIKKGFTVSNGIAWNLEGNLMYICDSPDRLIYQYTFDQEKGLLGQLSVFAQVPKEDGFPDGLTVDSEGCLWSCHWDGWKVTRYKPTGEIDSVIPMPVPRPTSCCFGGASLETLYITSASIGLSASELADAPQSGQLFAINTGVKGLIEPPYLG